MTARTLKNLSSFDTGRNRICYIVRFLLRGYVCLFFSAHIFRKNLHFNGIRKRHCSYIQGDVDERFNKEFEQLALPLLDPLYNFACWLSGDPDEGKDLVQETFVKALKAFASFHAGTNFRAWMFRILRNTFLTSRTGLERRNTLQQDEDGYDEAVVSHETPELALLRQADTELVRAAIAQLSPAFQEVLLLADMEEMKYQEVAETLAIPIGTVMSRLARARKQVREHIVDGLSKNKDGKKS